MNTLIIGAGLAGLSAGYTLAKAGRPVTIIEKESYPGGRVRSLPVDGHMVDFGGFIVYPWYTQYHRLTKELGIHKQFKKIPQSPIYYEMKTGEYTIDSDISFPIAQMMKLYTKTLPKLARYRPSIAKPALHIFGDQSISDYIRETLELDTKDAYETFADIVCQGYCYGPVDEYKMAVVAPVVFNTTLRGDLKDSVSFSGNNGLFTHMLAQKIIEMGGKIHYNQTITELSSDRVKTQDDTYKADTIICAARINKTLLDKIAPEVDVRCRYTNFYNVVIEFNRAPMVEDSGTWGAVFYLPDESQTYQVLSSVNVHEMTNGAVDPRFVNFNIVARTDPDTSLSPKELLTAVQKDLKRIFPDVTAKTVSAMMHWNETMPVADESFIQSMRELQGKNNIWFAGDYLGSPSMETAIRTGIETAKNILQK